MRNFTHLLPVYILITVLKGMSLSLTTTNLLFLIIAYRDFSRSRAAECV